LTSVSLYPPREPRLVCDNDDRPSNRQVTVRSEEVVRCQWGGGEERGVY